MRKNLRRRPEVEGLESMVMLSGAAGGIAELANNPPPITGPLMGSATGTFKTNGLDPLAKIRAKGNVSPIGRVAFSGFASFAILEAPGGTLNATTKRGKMTIDLGFSSVTDMGMGRSSF